MLLDARTGRTVWRRPYPFRRGQMEAHVLFGRDGALITSAAQGETLVWNARTGRIVRRYPIGGRPALSPDGRTLALALNSPKRRGHELRRRPCSTCAPAASGELAADLPDEWIMSLAFTRDGTRIVGPPFGGTHVWDVATGEIVETYRMVSTGRLGQRPRDRSARARASSPRRRDHHRVGPRGRAARRARVPVRQGTAGVSG